MTVMQLLAQIAELQTRLEGATALNIYLLHKLGGQATVEKDELQHIIDSFGTIGFSSVNDTITVKLLSGPPKAPAAGPAGVAT